MDNAYITLLSNTTAINYKYDTLTVLHRFFSTAADPPSDLTRARIQKVSAMTSFDCLIRRWAYKTLAQSKELFKSYRRGATSTVVLRN